MQILSKLYSNSGTNFVIRNVLIEKQKVVGKLKCTRMYAV
jgi:hypothetical protein